MVLVRVVLVVAAIVRSALAMVLLRVSVWAPTSMPAWVQE